MGGSPRTTGLPSETLMSLSPYLTGLVRNVRNSCFKCSFSESQPCVRVISGIAFFLRRAFCTLRSDFNFITDFSINFAIAMLCMALI